MRSRRYFSHAIAAATLGLAMAGSSKVSTQATCAVNTVQGPVQGQDRGASCAFLGIPFAAPPVGALRWKPPQAPPAWSTPPSAVTVSCPNINSGTPAGSEDCLKLNVWVSDPPPARPAPVIVWFHTGSFLAASSNFASHNGQRLAEETGVIVVAANYRLGALGFLAHPALVAEDPSTGNYGFQDQQAVLAWVRDNIAVFGGDPGNVTIAGTSAGGDSAGLHLIAPASAGQHLVPLERQKLAVAARPPGKGVDAIKTEDVVDAEEMKNLAHPLDPLPPPIEVVAPQDVPAIERDAPVLAPLLREGVVLEIRFGGRPARPVERKSLGMSEDVRAVINDPK